MEITHYPDIPCALEYQCETEYVLQKRHSKCIKISYQIRLWGDNIHNLVFRNDICNISRAQYYSFTGKEIFAMVKFLTNISINLDKKVNFILS